MRDYARNPVLVYAVAVLAVVAALLLRWVLDPVLGDHVPLATMYGAVAIAAWYGERLKGLCRGLLFIFAAADEPRGDKQQATAKALESFAGTWEIVKVTPYGATKDAKQLVFRKDGTYTVLDKDGKELWCGTFEIDPTAMPKVWDHRSHDFRKENKDILGIYELDGDALKVACVVGQWKGKEWVGKDRPRAFDPKVADVVIEMKRKAEQVTASPNLYQEAQMTTHLPEPAAGFVRPVNEHDPAGSLALFTDDAMVDDAGREIRGRETIEAGAAHDIFAANVTVQVRDVSGADGDATVTAKVDGTFDRTGLPDPLIMTFPS